MSSQIEVNFEAVQVNKNMLADSAENAAAAKDKISGISYYQTDSKWSSVPEAQSFRVFYQIRLLLIRAQIEKTLERIEKFQNDYEKAAKDLIETDGKNDSAFQELIGGLDQYFPPPNH